MKPAVSRPPEHHRSIRSFVHRRTHITPSQKQALADLLPQWSIPYAPAAPDYDAIYGRHADLVLEIGFGMGETTAQIAQDNPGKNFLGVEVFDAGVGALLKRIDDLELTNLRIIQHDAVEVVHHMLAPESLAAIHVFFPDPWPKKRHHKRRLIQAEFVSLLSTRLQPGGILHCATDWQNYAEHMLAVLSAEPSLENTANGFAPRPAHRPLTKFEQRGLRLGHEVHDLIFRKS